MVYISPRAKFLITAGAAESNPAMSSIPASSGSAIVNSLAAIPQTMSRASMPVASRYCCSATDGWTAPEGQRGVSEEEEEMEWEGEEVYI